MAINHPYPWIKEVPKKLIRDEPMGVLLKEQLALLGDGLMAWTLAKDALQLPGLNEAEYWARVGAGNGNTESMILLAVLYIGELKDRSSEQEKLLEPLFYQTQQRISSHNRYRAYFWLSRVEEQGSSVAAALKKMNYPAR